MKKEEIIKNYPKIEDGKQIFIQYPVLGKDSKYRGAEVIKDGFVDPQENPVKVPFDTFIKCMQACEIHNIFHFTPEEQSVIMKWSMNLGEEAGSV